MKMLSLFSGIGGIDLAAELAGIETVAFCEINEYCQKVLKKQWPDVPIYSDIRDLRGEQIGTVDIVAGGFPCQPYSIAGKRQGKNDDRHLWPELFRIISELRPSWVVGENVGNFVNMELENALLDLESIGYTTQAFIIPACSIEAKHERERVFIIANINSERCNRSIITNGKHEVPNNQEWSIAENIRDWSGWQHWIRETFQNGHWTEDNTNICGMVDGISKKLDQSRLKALGNAVVPRQIYPIFKTIVDIERRLNND
jgi:DNA (cytosine-5)-methyltransferase 1